VSARDGRYLDAHRILTVAEGVLPFPQLSRDRATFYFVGLPADEAPQAVRDAQTVLGYGLNAAFIPRRTRLGSSSHYILTAVLASGMKVELVALAEHVSDEDSPVREMAEVAA
jgi:hypothetical protein